MTCSPAVRRRRRAGTPAPGTREEGLDVERSPLAGATRQGLVAESTAHPLFATRRAQPLPDDATLARKHERDLGRRKRRRLGDFRDVRRLGGERSQELPPRGNIEEKIAHFDGRPRGTTRGPNL